MPPSSTATLCASYPAAISSRAARALVRSSTHAQYRMSVRSGGSEPSGTCPSAASIVASGTESAPVAWALSNSRRSRVSTSTARPPATSSCACAGVRPDTAGPSSGVAFAESYAPGGIMGRSSAASEKLFTNELIIKSVREFPGNFRRIVYQPVTPRSQGIDRLGAAIRQPGGVGPPKRGSPAWPDQCAGTLERHSSFLHYRLGCHHLHQWVFA